MTPCCSNEVHALVKRNPALMVRLRRWPAADEVLGHVVWIGECRTCMSTLFLAPEVVPPPADALADLVLG